MLAAKAGQTPDAASADAIAEPGVAATSVTAGGIEAREAAALFEQMDWRSAAAWALWALGFAELTRDNPRAVDEALGSPRRLWSTWDLETPWAAYSCPMRSRHS